MAKPRAKPKPKQKKTVRSPRKRRIAKRNPAVRARRAPSKRAAKAAIPVGGRHFGVRLLSLLLLVFAALTNSVVVFAATSDMQRLDRQTSIVLASTMQPKEYLYREATKQGLDYQLLERIAYCESKWRMVQNSSSSAYGFFQIIDGTARTTPQFKAGQSRYDAFTNIDMALYIFKHDGAYPWFESMPCWRWYQ